MVVVAALGATVVLPAMLATLGHRVDSLNLRRAVLHALGREEHHPAVGEGFWHRLAVFVMRRPLPIAAAIVAVLLG